TLALAYIISALNVFFRDLQHIVGNFLTLWFFLTPVVYTAANFPDRWRPFLVLGNPMTILITSYQAILYDHRGPEPFPLAGRSLFALALLWVASEVFERRREEFAELI